LAVGLVLALALLLGASSAVGAQEPEPPEPGAVDIEIELGGYDAGRHDFLVKAVVVGGELRDDVDFTVELRGNGSRLLWSATRTYGGSPMRIEVDVPVGVGDVTSTGISQAALPLDVQLVPPDGPSATLGTGGSGQLTLSMVVTIIVVAVVFRSPLPSAQTSRWTK
jgi:hypothetical protein